MEDIREKNEQFKEIKAKLRQTPRQSYAELEDLLSDVQDRRAIIFLLDAHETEKEITRDILESLIEKTMDINYDIIEKIENIISDHAESPSVITKIDDFFTLDNAKVIVMMIAGIGLVISIATNEKVANKLIDAIFSTEQEQVEKSK